MATITSAGLGSGLEIEKLITQLIEAESAPLNISKAKEEKLDAQISSYGKLSNLLSTFRTSVGTLNSSLDFKVFGATSSTESVATATTSSSSTVGQYAVEVVRLAENHKKRAGVGYADKNTTTVGVANDMMTLTVGSSSFSIEFGGKTLQQIQTDINGATDNTGVTASIVKGNGATPYQLVLTANETGSDSFLQVSYGIDPFGLADASSGANTTLEGATYYDDSDTTTIGTTGDSMTIDVSGAGDFTVNIGNMTLDDIANAINTDVGNTGVTASVENTTDGYRLKLVAGTAITATYTPATTLSNHFSFADLNVDRATTTGGMGDGSFNADDLDAIVEVDGTTATRISNNISDVVDGLTFNLVAAGTTTVTVNRDTATVQTRISDFVDAYNVLAEELDVMSEGELKNDTTLRGVQTQLRNLLNTAASGLSLSYLSEIGVNFILKDRERADGNVVKVTRLELNSTTLSTKLASNFPDVTALFSNVSQGFGYRLDLLLDNFSKSDGFLDTRSDGIRKEISRLDDQQENLALRLDLLEKRYRQQFSKLDILVSTLRNTSQFLSQQLSALPTTGGS